MSIKVFRGNSVLIRDPHPSNLVKTRSLHVCASFIRFRQHLVLEMYCNSEHRRLKSILSKRHLANGRMRVNQQGHLIVELGVEESYKTFTLHAEEDKTETG